jgi:hypothetical protein
VSTGEQASSGRSTSKSAAGKRAIKEAPTADGAPTIKKPRLPRPSKENKEKVARAKGKSDTHALTKPDEIIGHAGLGLQAIDDTHHTIHLVTLGYAQVIGHLNNLSMCHDSLESKPDYPQVRCGHINSL